MNRNILQSLASDWTRMAKNDIKTKVKEFMNEVETTPSELAYALAISEDEMNQILSGNGEITLSTFAKLLIATGNALEIKPINKTPIGDFHNIHRGGLPPHMPRFDEPTPSIRTQRSLFDEARQRQPLHDVRNINRPIFEEEDFGDDFGLSEDEYFTPPTTRHQQPRDAHGRFQSFHREAPSQSKFSVMPREKLVEIIKNNLWDSEIDTLRATKGQLVSFLDEKDKRISAMRNHTEEVDPNVNEFKNKLKNSVKRNPNLRKFLENLINED